MRVCDGTVLFVDLDRHTVKYLVDANYGKGDSAEQTYREAGAVVLDLIDSCLCQKGNQSSQSRGAHSPSVAGTMPNNQGDDFFFC